MSAKPQKKKATLADSEVLSKAPINPWVRLHSQTTAPDRVVDVAHIESLLAERTAAKAAKNYSVADKVAATLQDMHISYHDEQKTWYTKPLPIAAPTQSSQKLTKKQERNKRQAEKNRKKKARLEAAENSDDDDDDGSDSESEEEEVKPAKKSKKN